MNIILILVILLIFILVIFTIIDKFSLLSNYNDNANANNNANANANNDVNKKNNINNDIISHNNKYHKYNNDDNNDDDDDNDIIKDDKLFIKYSSIKNKLITDDDYINLHYFINEIKTSIYISEINANNKNNIIELISNDIQKTKLKYNFNKLKNIFVIIKKIDENIKIVIFYDGLLYNSQKFKFIENDYSGYTIVYKLNLNNKLFNHYLQ
jgi:hypothetical protein